MLPWFDLHLKLPARDHYWKNGPSRKNHVQKTANLVKNGFANHADFSNLRIRVIKRKNFVNMNRQDIIDSARGRISRYLTNPTPDQQVFFSSYHPIKHVYLTKSQRTCCQYQTTRLRSEILWTEVDIRVDWIIFAKTGMSRYYPTLFFIEDWV